jgi:spore germination protein YaaH
MKNIIIIIILVVLVGVIGLQVMQEKIQRDLARPIPYPTVSREESDALLTPIKDVSHIRENNVLFVPDWTLTDEPITATDYQTIIYFGVTPGEKGLDTKESGMVNLERFLTFAPADTTRFLTLRMTNTEQNLAILKDTNRQQQVIRETVSLAKEKGFAGIVLDLEIAAIPFDSLTKEITTFTKQLSTASKQEKLSFHMTIYGDTYYRVRPFEVKELASFVDTFLLMAYDLHKARGNPGPNFPLSGKEQYGYDLQMMVTDFTRVVSTNKLTVVFGLFGYDWSVDAAGKAAVQAEPLTINQIRQRFLGDCTYKNCSVDRDILSKELEIHYRDAAGGQHTVWAEDLESVGEKKTFLKQQGITSFGYWAYSYF